MTADVGRRGSGPLLGRSMRLLVALLTIAGALVLGFLLPRPAFESRG